MNHLARFVTRFPKAIIVACLLVTGLAAFKAKDLHFAYSFRKIFDNPSNPETPILDRYLEEFGDDSYFVLIILRSDNMFSPPVLKYVQDLAQKLEKEPAFRTVWSIATAQVPRGEGDDVTIGRLYTTVPTAPADLKALRRLALGHNLVVPRLLSADGRYTVVAAELQDPKAVGDVDKMQTAVDTVRRLIQQNKPPPGVSHQLGGSPVIETEIRNILIDDQKLFAGAGVLLVVVLLLLAFGSFHGVLLPLTAVGISVLWLLGLMSATGGDINLISNTTPTIMLICGLLDTVFILNRFYELLGQGMERREAARTTIVRMGLPCMVTSSTTAIGFACFAIGSITIMQQFGAYLAIGILFAYVTSIVWIPALLCVVPPPKKRATKHGVARLINRFVEALVRFVLRRHKQVVVVAVATLIGSVVVAALLIRIDCYYLKELPRNTEGMRANQVLSDRLMGVVHVAIVAKGAPGALEEPSNVKAIDQVEQWARGNPEVRSTLGLPDMIRAMNQAFHGGDRNELKIPSSRPLLAQYLALLDPETRADFVTNDYSKTHIRAVMTDVGSRRTLAFANGLLDQARRLLKNFELELSGVAVIAYHAHELLVKETMDSFIIAFLAIVFLVSLAARSVRLGLIGILPNLIPTAVCAAFLAIVGISLRTGTVIFACIAVGIVFDNTIYLFWRMKELRAAGKPLEESVSESLRVIGPPAIYTAIVISLGFGIFLLSDFEILKAFGLTTMAAVIVGLLADLTVTPSLLLLFGKRAFKGGSTPAGSTGRSAGE